MSINLSPLETSLRRVVEAVVQIIQGRSNAVGRVMLRANQTTTTVTRLVHPAAVNCAVGSEVALSPRTANAAAAVPTTWISSTDQGSFTITHANAVTVDREFGFIIKG